MDSSVRLFLLQVGFFVAMAVDSSIAAAAGLLDAIDVVKNITKDGWWNWILSIVGALIYCVWAYLKKSRPRGDIP